MTSLFGGGTNLNVNASGTLVPENFTPTDGQTLFTITQFTYTLNSNSLLVFVNGTKQRPGIDFSETSTTSFTLATPVLAIDTVEVIGFPLSTITQVSGTVVGGLSVSGNATVGGNLAVSGALTLGTDLAVAEGGTGASTAAGARTNLGAAASGNNNDILALQALTSIPTVIQAALDILIPAGTLVPYAGTSAPSGFLACPTIQTNVSRTTYARLFAAIGTTWGAGNGSTTFGMPWFPENYALVQANANVGTSTTGEVKSHTHNIGNSSAVDVSGGVYSLPGSGSAATSAATGGTANLAAGVRVTILVKI
jgi:Phage Tail Collar Domain